MSEERLATVIREDMRDSFNRGLLMSEIMGISRSQFFQEFVRTYCAVLSASVYKYASEGYEKEALEDIKDYMNKLLKICVDHMEVVTEKRENRREV